MGNFGKTERRPEQIKEPTVAQLRMHRKFHLEKAEEYDRKIEEAAAKDEQAYDDLR